MASLGPEVSLYDVSGRAVAYVALDRDATIYLWTGEPVAYLYQASVYGFNGQHLGWFEDGIIWDHSGRQAGFTASTLPVVRQAEPVKFAKYAMFAKYAKYGAPAHPARTLTRSTIPLDVLLAAGSP